MAAGVMPRHTASVQIQLLWPVPACMFNAWLCTCLCPRTLRVCAGFGTDSICLYSFQVLRLACLDFLNLIKHRES